VKLELLMPSRFDMIEAATGAARVPGKRKEKGS